MVHKNRIPIKKQAALVEGGSSRKKSALEKPL